MTKVRYGDVQLFSCKLKYRIVDRFVNRPFDTHQIDGFFNGVFYTNGFEILLEEENFVDIYKFHECFLFSEILNGSSTFETKTFV